MNKYFYYFLDHNLRKIILKIILRKIKKIIGLTSEKPFKFSENNIYNRDYILKNIFNINKPVHPSKIYKKLYLHQGTKLNENPYKFGGGADQELLFNISKNKKIENILETGVANGWSTLSILLAIRKDKNKTLTSIDLPYPYKNSKKYIGSAIPKILKKKQWKLILGIDYEILIRFQKKKLKFDLIHYDSDKNYHSKTKSFNVIWNLLNDKGFLISDDVSDNSAFVDFAEYINVKYYIYKFETKHIGIIQK